MLGKGLYIIRIKCKIIEATTPFTYFFILLFIHISTINMNNLLILYICRDIKILSSVISSHKQNLQFLLLTINSKVPSNYFKNILFVGFGLPTANFNHINSTLPNFMISSLSNLKNEILIGKPFWNSWSDQIAVCIYWAWLLWIIFFEISCEGFSGFPVWILYLI